MMHQPAMHPVNFMQNPSHGFPLEFFHPMDQNLYPYPFYPQQPPPSSFDGFKFDHSGLQQVPDVVKPAPFTERNQQNQSVNASLSSSSSLSSKQWPPPDDRRKKERREKNNQAAKESRKKRKEREKTLSKKVDQLSLENKALKSEIKTLQSQLDRYKTFHYPNPTLQF